jgi:hypothetical protein
VARQNRLRGRRDLHLGRGRRNLHLGIWNLHLGRRNLHLGRRNLHLGIWIWNLHHGRRNLHLGNRAAIQFSALMAWQNGGRGRGNMCNII